MAANETNGNKEKEKPDPYLYMFLMMKNDTYEYDLQVVGCIMMQLTLKKALKLWGNDAQLAMEAEVKQLHWQNSFKTINWDEILPEKKKAILESHIFVKKKRLGEVKASKVTGGNKQHDFIDKEDASSPMVTQGSVILTCMIDAKENQDVATIDIPNAFIQTVVEDSKDMVIIQIQGLMVDILEKIEPHIYGPYVTFNKQGNKQLLVEYLNIIYGTMVAILLYYRKITNSLSKEGYCMNPYNPCVWNKMIDGKQMTICFHVNDCKLSHVSPTAIDKTIEWLRRDYESIFEDGSRKMMVH